MKNTLSVNPRLTSRVISARASSTSARTSVDIWVVASLTRSPIDALAGSACGSTNGIDVIVLGTPFLRSPLATDGSSPLARSLNAMLPCGDGVYEAGRVEDGLLRKWLVLLRYDGGFL